MNQLIVSDNLKQQDDKTTILKRDKKAVNQTQDINALEPSHTPTSTRFPQLKKFAIRSLEDEVPSNEVIETPHAAHHNMQARHGNALPKLQNYQSNSSLKNKTIVNEESDIKSIPTVKSEGNQPKLGSKQKIIPFQQLQLEYSDMHQDVSQGKLIQLQQPVKSEHLPVNRSHPIPNSQHGSSRHQHVHNMPGHVKSEAAGQSLTSAHEEDVLVYSKAAIGRYIWSHLLAGDLFADETYPGTLVGNRTVKNVRLVYREGV